ncbi:hypothetical protein AB4508_21980 [Vibrio splendidus]|uniref:hypothetical protein n=1 Tax=Vibrio splendidus TaxID=29497 RepID=UPI00352F3E94
MPEPEKYDEVLTIKDNQSIEENVPILDKPKSKEMSNLATSIIVALITSVSTTAGMFYLTSYQKKIEQENWLKQQEYNEYKEEKTNLKKLVNDFLGLNSEIRTLRMERNSLYFQSQAILLKPDILEEIRLIYIDKISKKLNEIITKEKQKNSELTLKFSTASIFLNEDISSSILELFRQKMIERTPVNNLLKEFKEKVMNGDITSENFDINYADYALEASESAVDFEYEEKFNKVIKLVVESTKALDPMPKT